MFCFRRRCCCRCNRGNQVGEINFQELKDMVDRGAILIDVRSPQEYAEGHLPGAINIPEYEILSRVKNEIPKTNQAIVLYCQYGGRSKESYNIMKRLGYTNIFALRGGLEMI